MNTVLLWWAVLLSGLTWLSVFSPIVHRKLRAKTQRKRIRSTPVTKKQQEVVFVDRPRCASHGGYLVGKEEPVLVHTTATLVGGIEVPVTMMICQDCAQGRTDHGE